MTAIASTVRWRCLDGRVVTPQEMTTTHIFYAVRMIFNHLAPTGSQLPGGRYNGVAEMAEADPEWTRHVVNALLAELATRRDLPDSLQKQLEHMKIVCARTRSNP